MALELDLGVLYLERFSHDVFLNHSHILPNEQMMTTSVSVKNISGCAASLSLQV